MGCFASLQIPVTCDNADLGLLNPMSAAFGAKGDGITDDTAALQAWLSALPGKAGWLPPATYKITAGLSLAGDYASIVCPGRSVLKKAFAQPAPGLTITGHYNRLSGLEVDGGGLQWGSVNNGGIAIYGDYNDLELCVCHDNGEHGFFLCGSLVQGSTGSLNRLHRCVARNNGQVGFGQNHAGNNTIENCLAIGNRFEGITIDVQSFSSIVRGNRVASNCSGGGVGGIGIDAGDLSIVEGNHIDGTLGGLPGIKFQNNVASTNDCIIAANMLIDNSGGGIWLANNGGRTCSWHTIKGNRIRGANMPFSIKLDAGCNNNVVAGNIANGQAVQDSGTGNYLAGNL